MSSPATYPRCSAKSTDAPKTLVRCRPLMKPSTTERATSSRLPMRARTFGSTNRAPGMVEVEIMSLLTGDQESRSILGFSLKSPDLLISCELHAAPRHCDRLHQTVDQRIAVDS